MGLLDIAKVFHESLEKLERAYGSSQKLYAALEGVQSEWNGAAGQQAQGLLAYVETLRERMSFPDLGSILDHNTRPVTASARTTVRDCAKLMREHRTTCILIVDEGQKLLGLCTSKDIGAWELLASVGLTCVQSCASSRLASTPRRARSCG